MGYGEKTDYAKQYRGAVVYNVRFMSNISQWPAGHIDLVKLRVIAGEIEFDDPLGTYTVKGNLLDPSHMQCDCPATWQRRGRPAPGSEHKHYQWVARYARLVAANKAWPKGPQLYYDPQTDKFYELGGAADDISEAE